MCFQELGGTMFGVVLAFIVLVGIACLFILTFATVLAGDPDEEGSAGTPSAG
jgi:hypothetical protein